MYIARKNAGTNTDGDCKSLRDMLNELLEGSEVAISSLAEEIGINKDALSEFQKGKYELKLNQAIKLMKLLGLSESQFIAAYNKEITEREQENIEKTERLSYILRNFDIPTLKKIGIIKKRSRIEEYEKQICGFFGFGSIYEYDDTSLLPILFSKSKIAVSQEKEKKMNDFWLRCAVFSFSKIGNPYDYDRGLLIGLLKRFGEFTTDCTHGYERAILVLFRIGITVLTQPYVSGTRAFGVTMILDGKPCIVITDMKKKYHKLWLNLLHELYHVINDFEILQSTKYHISYSDSPELLLNEKRADQFALDALVHPSVRRELARIVAFPYKMKKMAGSLNVDSSILYGAYLESLSKEEQSIEFPKYANMLKPSDVAIRNIEFDAIQRRSLNAAIGEIREKLYRISI